MLTAAERAHPRHSALMLGSQPWNPSSGSRVIRTMRQRTDQQMQCDVAGKTPDKSRRLSLDIAATALLIGTILLACMMLSYSSLKFDPGPFWFSLGIQLLMFGGFLIIERLVPIGPHKSIRAWLVNLQINILSYFSFSFAGALGASVTMALGRYFDLGLIDLRFSANNKGVMGLIGAYVLATLVVDFFIYWYHRCQHMQFLWQCHKLHHMDPEMDVLTNNREHWLEGFFATFFAFIPSTIFFKMDSYAVGVVGAIIGFFAISWAQFYHSNIRIQLGWASVLIVCPQVHRIHHSRLPEHKDKNFAQAFPIWDILFGTYCHPVRDEFAPVGVEGEKEVQSLAEHALLPFREWHRMARDWIRSAGS